MGENARWQRRKGLGSSGPSSTPEIPMSPRVASTMQTAVNILKKSGNKMVAATFGPLLYRQHDGSRELLAELGGMAPFCQATDGIIAFEQGEIAGRDEVVLKKPSKLPEKTVTVSEHEARLENFLSTNNADRRARQSMQGLQRKQQEAIMDSGFQINADPQRGSASAIIMSRIKKLERTEQKHEKDKSKQVDEDNWQEDNGQSIKSNASEAWGKWVPTTSSNKQDIDEKETEGRNPWIAKELSESVKQWVKVAEDQKMISPGEISTALKELATKSEAIQQIVLQNALSSVQAKTNFGSMPKKNAWLLSIIRKTEESRETGKPPELVASAKVPPPPPPSPPPPPAASPPSSSSKAKAKGDTPGEPDAEEEDENSEKTLWEQDEEEDAKHWNPKWDEQAKDYFKISQDDWAVNVDLSRQNLSEKDILHLFMNRANWFKRAVARALWKIHGKGQEWYWIKIDVSGNENLGPQAAKMVLNFLHERPPLAGRVHLRILKMHHCWLRDAGMSWISKIIIRQSSPIHEIHLSHNEITDAGAALVMESLIRHPQQCYPFQDPFSKQGVVRFCPCWLRMEQNNVLNASELLEAAAATGCRYKVLSRSLPEWTPMRAPLKLAGSFETCPMFTGHLFYNQVKDGSGEKPKHTGKAAFSEAQERVKSFKEEVEEAPAVKIETEEQKEEKEKAEKKKEKEKKKDKKVLSSGPKVDGIVEVAAEMLRKESDQKMLATTFCARLYKADSSFSKIVHGYGGIAGFCEVTDGRLKFISGESRSLFNRNLRDPFCLACQQRFRIDVCIKCFKGQKVFKVY